MPLNRTVAREFSLTFPCASKARRTKFDVECLPLPIWQRSVGAGLDRLDYVFERAARSSFAGSKFIVDAQLITRHQEHTAIGFFTKNAEFEMQFEIAEFLLGNDAVDAGTTSNTPSGRIFHAAGPSLASRILGFLFCPSIQIGAFE